MCRIVGGYGRESVDPTILSEESKKASEQNGPCLTIAEFPTLDEGSGKPYYKIVKIFSQPVLHKREKLAPRIEMMYPKSYGGRKSQ